MTTRLLNSFGMTEVPDFAGGWIERPPAKVVIGDVVNNPVSCRVVDAVRLSRACLCASASANRERPARVAMLRAAPAR